MTCILISHISSESWKEASIPVFRFSLQYCTYVYEYICLGCQGETGRCFVNYFKQEFKFDGWTGDEVIIIARGYIIVHMRYDRNLIFRGVTVIAIKIPVFHHAILHHHPNSSKSACEMNYPHSEYSSDIFFYLTNII